MKGKLSMRFSYKPRRFFDSSAVIDLPMRLVVSLIIGTVALSAIIAFMMHPCIIPHTLSVSIDPLVLSINGSDQNVSIKIHVSDESNDPVNDAVVTIKGHDVIIANTTDHLGDTVLSFPVTIPEGISEIYLDVMVKASCARSQVFSNCIRVFRQDI